ncbi:MAG TPA: hypothetical protein VIE65_07695 [Methylobacter sp.]|jgi:hypothetical protein
MRMWQAIWLCAALLMISGCTKNLDESQTSNLINVGWLSLIVILIIGIIIIIYKSTASLAFVGIILGLICGSAIIMSVPIEFQYAFIGGIVGIGGDFLTSKAEKPETMVETLTGFVVKTTQAAYSIADATQLESQHRRVSQLIWSTIGTITLMLIVGRTLAGVR